MEARLAYKYTRWRECFKFVTRAVEYTGVCKSLFHAQRRLRTMVPSAPQPLSPNVALSKTEMLRKLERWQLKGNRSSAPMWT